MGAMAELDEVTMAIRKLGATRINKLVRQGKRGKHGDGGNLWLEVRAPDVASWLFRWKDRITKKDRSIFYGPCHTVDVEEARQLAKADRKLLLAHKNPKKERDDRILEQQIKEGKARTVSQVVEEYYDNKVRYQARNTQIGARRMLNRINAAMGDIPIARVDRHVWFTALNFAELWKTKNPTAQRVLSQSKLMFDYAIEHGLHPGPNPATWPLIKARLPKARQVHKTKHHEGVPYKKMGRFLQELRAYRYRGHLKCYEGRPPVTLCLELIALTGCRPGEARRAQWKEFDFERKIWTVPNDHLKMGHVHGDAKRVPITEAMRLVLEQAKKTAYPSQSSKWNDGHKRGAVFPRARHAPDWSPDALVFPNSVNEPFGEALLARFMRTDMKASPAKPHGFRTSLRDWMRAETNLPEILWEIQADHRGDKFKRTYGHDDQLDRRRSMMEQYGQYCSQPAPEPKPGEVVKLSDKRRSA
jgi:integrase